jgi:hypothetical protein
MQLSKRQIGVITDTVNDLFFRMKARLLGRFFSGPKLYFEVLSDLDPLDTLEGIFRFTIHSLYGADASIDEDQIKHLADITGNYIEAERLKTVNRVLSDAAQSATQKEFEMTLKDNIEKATTYINLVANTETKSVQAYAERDGIAQLASSMNIDDPNVAKLGIIDDKTCDNCIKLWHMQHNLNVPRVYKLSELRDGYMTDHKNPYATTGNTHPHCRHILTMIPPNMGFDASGQIKFVNFGYDIYADQRGK